MRHPQCTLKTLLWLMAVAAAFFAGVQVERERQRRLEVWYLPKPIPANVKVEF
jgi:hypothetical protein